jgi:hypothetical protein
MIEKIREGIARGWEIDGYGWLWFFGRIVSCCICYSYVALFRIGAPRLKWSAGVPGDGCFTRCCGESGPV